MYPAEFASLCRVCLGNYSEMFPLKYHFNEAANSINIENLDENKMIEEVLFTLLNYKGPDSENYPQNICSMCLGSLKIAYDFKNLFEETYQVILKGVGQTELPKTSVSHHHKTENQFKDSVELIAGKNKYSLKDLLIVEQEPSTEEVEYKGFLRNLGKTVSATFIGNQNSIKRVSSPTLDVDSYCIDELQKPFDIFNSKSRLKRNDINNYDQYIIVEEDEFDGTIIHITEDDNEHDNLNILNDLKSTNLIFNYECTICNQTYNSKSVYDNHLSVCPAQSELEQNKMIEDLIQSAVNLKYECDLCRRIYRSKTRYHKHINICHKRFKIITDKDGATEVISKYQCEYCSKSFKELKFLNYHVKGHKLPYFACEICKLKFKSRSSRNYHKVTRHSELKYSCQSCDKKFPTSAFLKVHVQVHERSKAQCICPVCGKTFHYKGGLFYHMKQHTKDRKYKCDHCEKCFYTLTAKKRHVLTHTGVRPYECQYCQKRFFSRGEVNKHQYIHTGVLPYKCKYCDKGFTSCFNMKIHWFNHHGSFLCDHCNRGFLSKEILQFHYKIKHKNIITEK